MKYQGKLYGLPFLQDDWGFYWNTDAFKEVGLDPTKPPTTPDELWTMAEKLTKYNADGSLARAGFIPDYPGKNLTELSQLFGCKYYDDATKKVTVNSPECVAWFDWYKKYYDKYNKHDELTKLVASKGSEDEDLFYTGKVAMGLFGEWVPGAAYAPNFAPNLNYETAPFPALSPDEYGAGFVNGNAFFIPTGVEGPGGRSQVRDVPHDRRPVTGDGHPERQRPPAEVAGHRPDADRGQALRDVPRHRQPPQDLDQPDDLPVVDAQGRDGHRPRQRADRRSRRRRRPSTTWPRRSRPISTPTVRSRRRTQDLDRPGLERRACRRTPACAAADRAAAAATRRSG